MKGPYRFAISIAVLTFLFQNCQPAQISNRESESKEQLSVAGGNGNGYDGKVFAHPAKNGPCSDGDAADAKIQVRSSGEGFMVRSDCQNLSLTQQYQVTYSVVAPSPGGIIEHNRELYYEVLPSSVAILQPRNCPSEGLVHGQSIERTEGTVTVAGVCPVGEAGTLSSIYQAINRYRCEDGAMIFLSGRQGALVRTNSTCTDVCTEPNMAPICSAYQYLFGRRPDRAGAEYWRTDLLSKGYAISCWTRYISFGTSSADCVRHRNIFGFYPNSPLCPATPRGDAPQAGPRPECAN